MFKPARGLHIACRQNNDFVIKAVFLDLAQGLDLPDKRAGFLLDNSGMSSSETRRQILNSLFGLLLDYLPKELTVIRFLQLAKFNRSIFYYYFENLADAQGQLEAELVTVERYGHTVRVVRGMGGAEELTEFCRENTDVLPYASR